MAGSCAGLAGMVEVAAVHGVANESLNVGYGYGGILVAFVARHNPLAAALVATLLGEFWLAVVFSSDRTISPMLQFSSFRA